MSDSIFSEDFMATLVCRVADELEARGVAGAGVPGRPWTVERLAEHLGDVSTDTIYRRVRAGEIAVVPGIGKRLIPHVEVVRLLEGRVQ